MPPLRLCFAGRTMPAHRGGRGMFYPYLMASALAERGAEVVILTTARPDGVERESPVPRLTIRYLRGTPPDRYSEEFWAESASAFSAHHEDTPFDAVISDSAGAAGIAPLSRAPVITVCHAGLDMMAGEPQRRFYRQTMHALMEASALIVCDARAAADSVTRGCPSVAGRTRVLRNFADPALFDARRPPSPALRRKLGLEGRQIVVYTGRVVPEKGLDLLVQAAAAVADPPALLVVGPGWYRSDLRDLANSLGVTLSLVPGASHDRIPEYLRLGDVFVLPTCHFEGLPFSLVEAFLCGLPAVACDIGGVREIVRNGENGFLIPVGDAAALADRLSVLLSNATLRRRLGEAGRALALAEFSLETAARTTEGLIRQVVPSSAGVLTPS